MVLSLKIRFQFLAVLSAILAVGPLCCLSSCLAETVLLDFSSPSCGPCQQMRPVVARLIADGLPVREVDISREPQLATRYGVTQVPTFLLVVDGKPVSQVVGKTSYETLHAMVRQAMPAPAPRRPVMALGQSPDTKLQTPANPFGSAPSRPAAAGAGSQHSQQQRSLHQRLLEATVRISVEDAQGKSAGTGTIVDARSGEALILTCGHLFRTSEGKGPITITTFQAGTHGATPSATYSGQLIDYDLERDLALVSMRPTSPVAAVSIANHHQNPLSPRLAVTSVGCSSGQDPTAIDSQVTSINRYQGTPNVEVAGAPIQGRSGGGLFNAQGELVGVCYAADPEANEGLYASLPAIYAKLDSLKLTMIYQRNANASQLLTQTPPSINQPASPLQRAGSPLPPPATPSHPLTTVRGQEPEAPITLPASLAASLASRASAMPTEMRSTEMSDAERAMLEEISRRGINSEVVCIIRPQDPNGKSEIITLQNASPAFVQALANPTGRPSPTNSIPGNRYR